MWIETSPGQFSFATRFRFSDDGRAILWFGEYRQVIVSDPEKVQELRDRVETVSLYVGDEQDRRVENEIRAAVAGGRHGTK